ncbi:MAG: MotA/TolQ/ExbB proton channel family protein [Thalassovita sp.]
MIRISTVMAAGVSAGMAQAQSTGPEVKTVVPSFPIPETPAPALLSPSIDASTPIVSAPHAGDTFETILQQAVATSKTAAGFLQEGGPAIWAIAALSVVTVTLILWKIWRLALLGAWSRGKSRKAVSLYERHQTAAALSTVQGRMGIRSKVVHAALVSVGELPQDSAREETTRIAKRELAQAASGLRALELIASIAPLLGLLGTVLGMIAAFQALQQAGSRADPALLAGGIWEALLTTAAGMAVAIPASAALTWFESILDRIRQDVEDSATRIFVCQHPAALQLAAE